MPKKSCRYNNKHKFDTDDALLSHEKYCPDKSKRTDLKECPFSNKHIVLTKQYEKHIKICKYRPKNAPQKEDQKNNENNNINSTDMSNDEKNKKIEDWELKVDEWIDDSVKKDEIDVNKNKLIIEKLKTPSNQDVFDDDDFIFKQCYI